MPSNTNHIMPPAIANDVVEQAKRLEVLIPELSRRLFAVSTTEPTAGLPASQLKICLLLIRGARCISEISEEMKVTVSAITQLADRLESAGMVKREVDTEDRRVKRLVLTEYGKTLLQSRQELRVRRVAEVLALVSPELVSSLCDGLQGVLEAACLVLPDMQNAVIEVAKLLG